MLSTEVLILGGGPAGATAALNLAPTRRVIVVEAREAPAERIGESLSSAAGRLMADMGLLEAFHLEGHSPWYGNRSIWGGTAIVESDFLRDPYGHGWHLDRPRFEAFLRKTAVERGAHWLSPMRLESTVWEEDHWLIKLADGHELTSRVLIDASGRSASLARMLGGQVMVEDDLVCRWCYGSGSAQQGITFIEAVEDGWWYTAPLPNDRRVLAFHTTRELMAQRGEGWLNPTEDTLELKRVLHTAGFQPQGRDRVVAAHSARLAPFAGHAWLAAGDAALSFDPLSSQGLLNALFTGLASAEATDRFLSGEAAAFTEYSETLHGVHSAYRSHLRQWYGMEQRWPEALFWKAKA